MAISSDNKTFSVRILFSFELFTQVLQSATLLQLICYTVEIDI